VRIALITVEQGHLIYQSSVRKNQKNDPEKIAMDNQPTADEGGFFNPTQISYNQLRTRARLDKVEANAQLEIYTQTLIERMSQVEQRAFAGDPVATQTYVSDARQMVTEFRQARVLFPRERVSDHNSRIGYTGVNERFHRNVRA